VIVLIVFVIFIIGILSSGRKTESVPSPQAELSTAPRSEPSTAAESAPTPVSWEEDLEITKKNWSLSEFSVATWNVRVHNKSKTLAYKDLHFKTVYSGPSGTVIDRSIIGHTEYQTVRPGRSISITFTEFAHSQSVRASISIDGAEFAY
jgi:hypothetical protein